MLSIKKYHIIWRNTLLRELPKAPTTTCILETIYNIQGNDLGHGKNVGDKYIKMGNPQVWI
jgi:hypothetical protein